MSIIKKCCYTGLLLMAIVSCDNAVKLEVANLEKDKKEIVPAPLNVDSLEHWTNASHYFIVGNWGNHNQGGQAEITEVMERVADKLNPSAIWSVGDQFLPMGVQSDEDPSWNSSFEKVYQHHLFHCPWYITLGDRAYKSSVQAQMNYTAKSARWKLPAAYYQKQLMNQDSSSLILRVLNTSVMEEALASEEMGTPLYFRDSINQVRWLQKGLVKEIADWNIVMGHHEVLSNNRAMNSEGASKRLTPLLRKYNKVDFYLSGNEGNTQVHQIDTLKTVFIVNGGGSITEAGSKHAKTEKFSSNETAFTVLSLTKKKALIQVFNSMGLLIYKQEIIK